MSELAPYPWLASFASGTFPHLSVGHGCITLADPEGNLFCVIDKVRDQVAHLARA
jgi:hypothetical protein